MQSEIINREHFYLEKGCHPKDSFIIVLEGSFNCSIDNKNYVARKNDVFVYNSNAPFVRSVITPLTCIYIQFDGFPKKTENGILEIKDVARKENTINYLEKAVKEGNNDLINHFVNDLFILKNMDSDNSQKDDYVVKQSINYFYDNYGSQINLDTLAKEFNISKQWLISRFKASKQKTPMEYLNSVRLQFAKKYLTDTDLPCSEIAIICGYDNTYYFSNTFKKQVGMSPTMYRKRNLL